MDKEIKGMDVAVGAVRLRPLGHCQDRHQPRVREPSPSSAHRARPADEGAAEAERQGCLDPHRSEPRLIQAFGGGIKAAVFDMRSRGCPGLCSRRSGSARWSATTPIDMMDWLLQDDIVHLIIDAVGVMDLWPRTGGGGCLLSWKAGPRGESSLFFQQPVGQRQRGGEVARPLPDAHGAARAKRSQSCPLRIVRRGTRRRLCVRKARAVLRRSPRRTLAPCCPPMR